jgi:hypothetical protein
MLRRLRPRSVYDVCAAMALFVALGGTAYAVNTVGSADIIDGQVKSVDIGDGEVSSADVKDQSLTTFDVSTFLGADIVDGTLTSDDIASFTIRNVDIADNAVESSVVQNGTLNDEDIGQTVVVDFVGGIGVVPANSCIKRDVILTSTLGGDHMVLTPNTTDAAPNLSYTGEYQPTGSNGMIIKVCNPTTANIDDGNTHFSVLAIDAQ